MESLVKITVAVMELLISIGSKDFKDCLDLTVLSKTMVYSEVYNMMMTPSDYEGRMIKAKGIFSVYEADEAIKQEYGTEFYYYVVIQDATACCQQGIEFLPPMDYKYPLDFPSPGTQITVTGIFQTYYEGKDKYVHLSNAIFDY